jgi:hypothetical protein
METPMIIAIVAIVLLAALVVAWVVFHNKRSQNLKQQFGNEYFRALEQTGSRSRAEALGPRPDAIVSETAPRRSSGPKPMPSLPNWSR